MHQRWVKCLETEFFRQGDREKAAGIPISPLFDRDKPGVTKSQVGPLVVDHPVHRTTGPALLCLLLRMTTTCAVLLLHCC